MPRWFFPFLIVSAIVIVLEFYAFQVVKTLTKNSTLKWFWILISIGVYLHLFYRIITTPRTACQTIEF